VDCEIQDIMLKSVCREDVFPLSPPFLSSPVLFPRICTCRTSGMASSCGVKITSSWLVASVSVPGCVASPSPFPCKSLKKFVLLRTCVPEVSAGIVLDRNFICVGSLSNEEVPLQENAGRALLLKR